MNSKFSSLKRRVNPLAVTECVTFYEMLGDNIVKTESMNFETLAAWMQVAGVKLVPGHRGTTTTSVSEFLQNCEWERNEQGLMCSVQFLALIGKKKYPSTCWVIIK